MGLAFGLLYSVTKRFHFALAITYTIGALTASLLTTGIGMPFPLALVAGVVAGALSGLIFERWVYRPVAVSAGASNRLLTIFVASLGLTIAGENLIRLAFGSETRTVSGFPDVTFLLGSVRLSGIAIMLLVLSLLVFVGLSALLKRSSFGTAIRATRSNEELAGLFGVNTGQVYLGAFVIGSSIAALVGVMAGTRYAVLPDMGLRPVFYAFVVAFLARVASPPLRFLVVGLLVGVGESISVLWLSTSMTQVLVFGVLFVFVAFRSLDSVGGQPFRRTWTRVSGRPARGAA